MFAATYDYARALSSWRSSVWLSMVMLLGQYSRGSRMGFILALLEPLIVIVGLYVFRGLFKGTTASYGTSLFLFLASGFLPFYVFIRVSSRARSTSVGPRGRLPGLTTLDSYIASIVLNSLIWITMMVVIFWGMWLYGIERARPASIVDCTLPVLLFIALGAGVGMINNVINRFITFWSRLYAVLTRGLVFMSGVMFIVDLQPLWLRAWTVANPLSHGVEWFRLGVYGRYPHNSLDPAYLVEWALIALFLGVVIDRAALRLLDNN